MNIVEINDSVEFKRFGKVYCGKILGVNGNEITIEIPSSEKFTVKTDDIIDVW